MGLFDQQQPSQPSQDPQGGVDPNVGQRFNGVVQSDAGPIEIKNGIANVEGEVYFVSDDGKLVVDSKTQGLVAIIQNGKVIEPTAEIIDQLTQQGIIEKPDQAQEPQGMMSSEQPQGLAIPPAQ